MAVARNADRNPNLGVDMKSDYKMPKKKSYSMKSGNSMSNPTRAANVKRMGKTKHNPSY